MNGRKGAKMINKDFVNSLNLPAEKTAELQAALDRESYYSSLLYRAGIMPGAIGAIMRATDTGKIDPEKDDLNMERVRVEWAEFIKKGA